MYTPKLIKNNYTFIVGKPRSGTTWLFSLLGNHPQCQALYPKTLDIKLKADSLESGLFVRGFSDDRILKKLKKLPLGKYVEKTPSHLLVLPKIKKILPESKIILIKRNYLDVIYSMIQPNNFWKGSPQNIEDAVSLYNTFSKAENKYTSYIDYTINYENLWNSPENELTKLFNYLNIDTSPIKQLLELTHKGKNLPDKLKKVFRKGVPHNYNYSKEQIQYINKYLIP